jgi:uncharacterized Zn-finger protein
MARRVAPAEFVRYVGRSKADGLRASPRLNPAASATGIAMPTPAPEVITVHKRRVSCDGGGGALGHPRVYLEMGEKTEVECGYCDRRFVLSREAIEADDH